MNEYVVEIAPQAQEQMDEIAQYIKIDLHSPASSAALMKKLAEEIRSLSLFPARVALMKEEWGQRLGIHRLPVKKHLIYFTIDEEAHRVRVFAVLYGKRDLLQQLLGLDL